MVEAAVEGSVGGDRFDGVAREGEHGACDYVGAVEGLDEGVDFGAVEARRDAGAGFEMDCYAGGGCEGGLAEGTGDGTAYVGAAMLMLFVVSSYFGNLGKDVPGEGCSRSGTSVCMVCSKDDLQLSRGVDRGHVQLRNHGRSARTSSHCPDRCPSHSDELHWC